MKQTFHILASGIVQGVGYRKFAQAKANELDIKGSVKNLATLEVEIYATAELEILEAFISLLKIGPERAKVHEVKFQNHSLINFNDFRILKD